MMLRYVSCWPANAAPGKSSAVALERTDEWLGVGVPLLDPGFDVAFECGDAVVDAAADLAVGEEPEPAFDLVQPRGAGRGEVQMESWVGREPGADRRGLVGGQVVADQVHIQFGRHGLVDLGQELLELGGAVSSLDGVDDQPGRDIQRGE